MPVVLSSIIECRCTQADIWHHAVVRHPPTVGVESGKDIALEQAGQAEVFAPERACTVISRDAASILRSAARVEVNPDQDRSMSQVGAPVPHRHVVVHALRSEDPAGEVLGPKAADERVGGPRHDHRVPSDRKSASVSSSTRRARSSS